MIDYPRAITPNTINNTNTTTIKNNYAIGMIKIPNVVQSMALPTQRFSIGSTGVKWVDWGTTGKQ